MTFTQTITPNPDIAAEEGMCLQYVRQTFGLPIRYGSATEAWNNSPSQHRDRTYPQGVWFPVWWGLDKNANGHVALVAPDGSVYSTSDLAPSPLHHHPSVADVEAYYARYGMLLTYRGWTEDVAGYPVITSFGGIAVEGSTTITEEDDFMPGRIYTDDEKDRILAAADMLLDTPGRRPGPRVLTTNDGAYIVEQVAGHAQNLWNGVQGIPAGVLNQTFKLADGTTTNLAGILTAIHAQPAAGTVVNQTSDPSAVVAAIKAQWNK